MSNKIKQKKVLVAEDDKLISRAFEIGLKNAGFLVVIALNGQEAIDKSRDERPDIIILDLDMPIRDGFEVLAEIQANKELKKIPIIILTNLEGDKEKKKAKKMGASKYLLKANFTMEDIVPIINNYFN